MIACFDASALIYLLEAREPFAERIRGLLVRLQEKYPDLPVAISGLSWLECRVHPMKMQDARTLALYDAFFARPDLVWVEVNRDVIELATEIRVRHGLRAPDAIQAASCLQLGRAHRFLSGDRAFGRVSGLNALSL